MEKYLDVIKGCSLFAGIESESLLKMLECLSVKEKHFAKNQFVFMTGDAVSAMGIVLSGVVHVIQEDVWGNRTILAGIGEGGLFGEAFSASEIERLPVSVVAVSPCDVLLLDYRKVIKTCSSACVFHTALIHNMLHILAGKNVMLTRKMEVLTRRTTREKLLAYLSAQAQQHACNSFDIPFNRQELAEYLSVDRSAMCNELSKLQREGVLSYRRSSFTLLNL